MRQLTKNDENAINNWRLKSRKLKTSPLYKINRIHERALRITYNDKSSSYGELLTKDRSVTIHHKNIRALAIEIYKEFPHHF